MAGARRPTEGTAMGTRAINARVDRSDVMLDDPELDRFLPGPPGRRAALMSSSRRGSEPLRPNSAPRSVR